MALELNREYPGQGESEIISEMVQLTIERMKKIAASQRGGCIHRGEHAKPTSCVRATFKIRDDLPEDLRHGVFRQPNKTFDAIVRFSNSSATFEPDGKGAGRGMAIKLLDVDGTPAIANSSYRCQDFLMIDNPTFPFPTPAEYLKFFRILLKVPSDTVGEGLAFADLVFRHPRCAQIAMKIRNKRVASPLELNYWSVSPYWLGPPEADDGRTVKYSVVPSFTGTRVPLCRLLRPNYLSTALVLLR
jgi:catalase